MRTPVQEELITLLRFELTGAPLPEDFRLSDPAALFRLARRFDLAHLVYDALRRNGRESEAQPASADYFRAVWRVEQLSFELKQLRSVLEEAEIPFLPLKGSVMRTQYPAPWMRTSSDIDLLVRPEDLERTSRLLEEHLSYHAGILYGQHQGFSAPENGMHIEVHHTLWTKANGLPDVFRVLERVWEEARPAEGCRAEHVLSPEMFTFYHLAHLSKHLRNGGCGPRPLLDLWLLERRGDRDPEKFRALLSEGGLETLYEALRCVSESWMTGSSCAGWEETEQYILTGGLYGDLTRSDALGIEKRGSKLKLLSRKVFLPREQLAALYPEIKDRAWLTPVAHMKRWGRLLKPSNLASTRRKTRSVLNSKKETVEEAVSQLERLGLWEPSGSPEAKE